MERYGDEEQSAGWRKPSRRNPKGRRALRLRAALRLLMDPFHWVDFVGAPGPEPQITASRPRELIG